MEGGASRMHTRFTVGTGLVAATLLLAGCSSTNGTDDADRGSGEIVVHNCGRDVTLPHAADAAITVNQGATESALAIGAGGQLIGTAYLDDEIAPQWADAYKKIPVLAPEYPDREKVIEAKPDLVAASYASAFDDKALGSRDELAGLGIETYVSPFGCADKSDRPDPSWDAIAGETSDYGKLFGREDAADTVNDQMRATLDTVTTAKAGADKKIFWYDSATDTPFVGAGDGGPQLIIDAVGGTNVFDRLEGGWADGNWEDVVRADPDVIVLADAGWDTAAAKRTYLESDPVLKNLRAVRDGAFVVLPFSESTPGARLIDGAKSVSDQLAKL
nr:ABC transporter substrate-binding protein [Gordonia humi]